MDAYLKNPDVKYLNWAKEIYQFMITGLDTITGGGIYWKENDFRTKNTCSNGPGIILALQLYQATGDSSYLVKAKELYQWINKYLRSDKGVFWDNITTHNKKTDSTIYSYNTGSMIQANVKLFKITSDQKYLNEAKFLAEGSYNHFFKDDIFLSTNYWFNAVLLRGYQELYELERNSVYIKAMQSYADDMWDNDCDENNLFGKRAVKTLLDQAGILEIYLRLEQLNATAL